MLSPGPDKAQTRPKQGHGQGPGKVRAEPGQGPDKAKAKTNQGRAQAWARTGPIKSQTLLAPCLGIAWNQLEFQIKFESSSTLIIFTSSILHFIKLLYENYFIYLFEHGPGNAQTRPKQGPDIIFSSAIRKRPSS